MEFEEVSEVLLDYYQRKQKNSIESSGEGLAVKSYQDRGRKKDKDEKPVRGRSKSKNSEVLQMPKEGAYKAGLSRME